METVQSILTDNSCYKAGKKCVHAFIDGNTGLVYQMLPWDHRGWHCGGAANGTHIGVEMCEPSSMVKALRSSVWIGVMR